MLPSMMSSLDAADYGSVTVSGTPAKGSRQQAGKRRGKEKTKKWVPPIPVRQKRQQASPGPGAYEVYAPHTCASRATHGKFGRSSKGQDNRDFYFGCALSSTTSAYGRDR